MIYFAFIDSGTTDTRVIYDEISVIDRQQAYLDLYVGGIFRFSDRIY